MNSSAAYTAVTDNWRNVMKVCGKCRSNGLTKAYGAHWVYHWKKNHAGKKPFGFVKVVQEGAHYEIPLDQYNFDLKYQRSGNSRTVDKSIVQSKLHKAIRKYKKDWR